MHKFRDNAEREWIVELDGYQLKKLKQSPLNFDARDHESILRAANDPVLLCDVLYLLCEDQAKDRGLSDRDFGRSLRGDTIDLATEAYIEETIDFFPQRLRQALRTTISKTRETLDTAASLATEKLNSPQMNELLQTAAKEASRIADKMISEETEKLKSNGQHGTSTGGLSGSLQESQA